MEFNLKEWEERFPWNENLVNGDEPPSSIGMTPCGIAHYEQYRKILVKRLGLSGGIPVDVFALALGEPEDRFVTKIGGLPYREAGLDWPTISDAHPLTFLVQFDFRGSTDILDQLPGDRLLVFVDNTFFEASVSNLYFEWGSGSVQNPVVQDDMPPPCRTFVTAYGYRHRTVDYHWLYAGKLFQEELLKTRMGQGSYPLSRAAKSLCITNTIKIGGLPFLWDGYHTCFSRDCSTRDYLLGRHLCSVVTVFSPDGPFPWINHPDPMDLGVTRIPRVLARGGARSCVAC